MEGVDNESVVVFVMIDTASGAGADGSAAERSNVWFWKRECELDAELTGSLRSV